MAPPSIPAVAGRLSLRAHSPAAERRTSATSRGSASRGGARRAGGAGYAPRDVDQQAAAGAPAGGSVERRAEPQHRLHFTALCSDAGTSKASPRAIPRIRSSSAGAVAPTTRPTVPPGPHSTARRATLA